MAERIAVYRYEIAREGEPAETRWSFAPVKPSGYAGHDEPKDANPMSNDTAEVGEPEPAGHVEAPDGTSISTMEPPTLEIPGRGKVDLSAVLGATEGDAGELGQLIRFRPRGG